MAEDIDLLEEALQLAEDGFRIIPLHTPDPTHASGCSCRRSECNSVGKHPRTANGVKDATLDEKEIRRWWATWPDANIGIATGGGLVVLDVDPRHDGDSSLEALEGEYGEIVTRSVRTGGGGLHLYLQGDLPSRGAFRPGLDLKAEGGYVVAPPSLHVSERQYKWMDRGEGIRVVPDGLARIVRGSRSRNGKAGPVPDVIPCGERNRTMASLAGTMRRVGMPEEAIYAALRATPCEIPLPDDEVAAIAHSIATNYEPVSTERSSNAGEGKANRDEQLTLTDSGNATRLVAMHGDGLHYIAPWREWLVFDPARGAWLRDQSPAYDANSPTLASVARH